MSKSPRKVFAIVVVLIFLTLSQTSCFLIGKMADMARQAKENQKSFTSQSSKNSKPTKGGTISNDRPFVDFQREIINDLRNENFDAIDRKADKARRDKERFLGGYWKIYILYGCLTEIFTDGFVTEDMWTKHLEKLNRWKQQSPTSITARIALAKSYAGYGWFARGNGFSNTVTDEDSEKLRKRLAMAYDELISAEKLRDKCPEWYKVMLFLAMAQSWDDDDYDELFDAAIKFEPDYYYYYYSKAENSSPRWGGRKGDMEKFAAQIENVDSKEKDILYYLYASEVANHHYDEWVDHQSISWTKAKNGYKQLEKIYGIDKLRLNQYSFIASTNEDMPEAYKAFKQIGNDFDNDVYSEKRFNEVKSWAIARYESENPK